MPRVVTAVNEYTKIKAYGFCNIAWSAPDGYKWLASLINRNKEDLDVVTAGLNHFAWLVSIKEKNTGKDLYDEVINAIATREGREFKVMRKWLKEYGLVPMGSVDHHGEYLPYDSDIEYATKPPYHGDERERAEALKNLKDVAEGKVPYDVAFKMLSWEHPVDLAVDIFKKRNKHHDMINLPNKGFIEGIPDGRIVEVPVDVIDGDVIGQKIPPLPQRLTQTLNIISDVHELSAKAAVFGDIKLAEEVIELDFAIPDKEKAKKALHDMIRNHIDILPQFT
ncbi:family 4 glycosyl hydrolase [Caldanaerobius fijiensis]|nr:hypothetical protein [Caldanaerobius fijiensis]